MMDNVDTLTRRNSYRLAIESDEIKVSHDTEDKRDEAPGNPTDSEIEDGEQQQKKKKAINFCQALLIPGVIVVSMCAHCIYCVYTNYTSVVCLHME